MWDDDFDWGSGPLTARPKAIAGTWTTAKGENVKFTDMEHKHLLNTIAYVERNFREMQDTFCDAALDINLIWPQHAGLVAEARRRNLIPKGNNNELVTT